MDDEGARRGLGWEVGLGGLLLLGGIVVLLGQALQPDLAEVGWPFYVIGPGVAVLGLGLATGGRLGEVLAMAGGVITVDGLVLLVQEATGRFETWAYAWTLALVGAGGGRWLLGVVRRRRDLAASGGRLVLAGLAAFVVLAVFFELVIGIGGRRYVYVPAGRYAVAALLIVAGLALLGRRLLAATRR